MALEFTTDSCKHCEEAKTASTWYFTGGCRGCCARAAGRSPEFHQAKLAGRVGGAYRRLLEQFGLTHEEVRAAHEADHETKAAASR